MANDNCYGNDNPPYSLYQNEFGFWGLMDKEGVYLPAVFSRDGDLFTCVPDEVVTFSPDEGFELQAYCDLDV